MFTLVLLNGYLDDFSKFIFFIVKICMLIWDFWVIFENYSMHMLSICGNDFITHWAYEETVSSTVFTWTSEHMLSICGNDFIAHWAYAETAYADDDFIACSACAEPKYSNSPNCTLHRCTLWMPNLVWMRSSLVVDEPSD